MKRFLLLLVVIFSCAFASNAQDNTFGGGYRGFADLGYTIGVGGY